MRKLYLFVLFILFSTRSISAAEGDIIGWAASSCMIIEECRYITNESNKCEEINPHTNRLRLDQSKKPPANSEAYLTECVKVNADETYCTTGDQNLDNAIAPLNGHLNKLISDIKYNVEQDGKIRYYDSNYSSSKIGEGYAKLATDASGNLVLPGTNKVITSIEWKSHNPPPKLPRNFKIWTPIREAPPETEVVAQGVGGQQQSILSFPSGGPGVGCDDYISYDPEGRVFDAVTLDPIPNVAVTLLQRDQNGIYSKEAVDTYHTEYKVVNPFVTESTGLHSLLGAFNFFVVDGFYKLLPSNDSYTFPDLSFQNRLPANTNKIYSQIYFSDSLPIEQKGKIEHRDIPLFPKDGIGKRYPEAFTLLYDSKQFISSTIEEYSGQVSHPFAKATVELCSSVSGTEVCGNSKVIPVFQGGPGKDGKFRIQLNQSQLKLGERYRVTFEPVNLTELIISSKKSLWSTFISFVSSLSLAPGVSAQTKSVSRTVEPIPSYIEGYAYDKNGTIVPNAIVYIYVPFAEGPMLQIKADTTGHFKITSEYLPKSEYTLAYSARVNQADKMNITTSQFLSQNKEFIEAEKINPYLVTSKTTDPRRNVTPSFVPLSNVSAIPISAQPTSSISVVPPTTEPQATSNNLLLIGAILLLLVATVGTLLGVYLYKKKMQDAEPQM